MLRDILRGKDDQIAAIAAVITRVDPDILLLTDFDFDLDGVALGAFADLVGYDVRFALPTNAGLMTRFDLDRNGRTGEARDAQGYGRYAGNGGMAILSRWPVVEGVQDFTGMLWRDLEGATLPEAWPQELQDVQRLSSTGHWIVPFETPLGLVNLLAWSATPPVFDGPEDLNGLRNRDELRLIAQMMQEVEAPIVVGLANVDPFDGDGLSSAMAEFLKTVQDPMPRSVGGVVDADSDHIGDPALDTAKWPKDGPANLRVSYVLPSVEWQIKGAGVFWPAPDDPDAELLGSDGLAAGPHRLVWVDVSR